jgi:hypothetical protein
MDFSRQIFDKPEEFVGGWLQMSLNLIRGHAISFKSFSGQTRQGQAKPKDFSRTRQCHELLWRTWEIAA